MTYTDCHCHLSDKRIYSQSTEIIKKAKEYSIEIFFLGGYSPEEWHRQLELKRRHPASIYTSFGIHPWWLESVEKERAEKALHTLSRLQIQSDAIGELGLDSSIKNHDLQKQENFFEKQLEIAKSNSKVLVLHIVGEHERATQILKRYQLKALVHSFSGSVQELKRYLDLGFYISVSGRKIKQFFEFSSYIPDDKLLVESDAPDAAIGSAKKGQNRPWVIIDIAKEIAQKRKTDYETILSNSTKNLKMLLTK